MMTFDHRLPAHKPFARCAFLTFVFEDTKKSLVCFDRTRGDANLADVIIARQRPLCLQATARAVWTKVPARSEAFAVVERIHCVQDVLLPSTRLMLEVASCWQVVAGLRQETNRFVQCNSHSYFTSFGTTVTAILPRLVPQSQLFCLVRHNSHSYFTSFGATVTAVLPRSAQQSQLFYLVRCHSQSYFASFGATVTPILPRLVPQSQLFCLVRHNSHSYFTVCDWTTAFRLMKQLVQRSGWKRNANGLAFKCTYGAMKLMWCRHETWSKAIDIRSLSLWT